MGRLRGTPYVHGMYRGSICVQMVIGRTIVYQNNDYINDNNISDYGAIRDDYNIIREAYDYDTIEDNYDSVGDNYDAIDHNNNTEHRATEICECNADYRKTTDKFDQ